MKHFSSDQPRRGFGHPTTLLLAALLLTAAPAAFAQTGSVGIGTTAPDVSAALDIVSSSKGALLPRVADATAIATPATGLLVFQTGGTPGFYYNAGTPAAPSWQQLATATGIPVTASNGLTKTGADIALGGTLSQTTTIVSAGFDLNLTGTGNVGIGGSGSFTRLSISPGTVEPKITLWDGGSTASHYGFGVSGGQLNYHVPSSGDRHVFFAGGKNGDGTELLRIQGNGNVGIGTASPGQRLEVAGQVFSSTGGFRFPDNTVQTTAASTVPAATANNGLTKTGNNIGLGGTLSQATAIAQAGNSFSLSNSGFGAAAIDQQQLAVNATTGGTDQWQSFTASVSGNLTQLDLLVSSPNANNAGQPGGLNIYAGVGVSGTNLASQSIFFVNVSNTYQPFVLNAPVAVVAGQQYTYRIGTFSVATNFVSISTANPYAGGQSSYSATSDLCFKTYVAPTAFTNILTALPTGNVGIGTASPGQRLEVAGQVFSSTGGFRFPDNTVQATAANTTVSNGLTKTGNNIVLGGLLSQATTISQAGNTFSLTNSGLGAVALDQQQLVLDAGSGGAGVWQSFTVGASGSLTQLDLRVSSPTGANGAPGTLSIYAGEGISGTLLTTQAIVYNNVLNTYQQYPLSAPVAVVAGQQYTYYFQTPTTSFAYVDLSNANPYAGGRAIYSATGDLCFKTYVSPTVVTNVLTALASGSVGIGTPTPTQQLEVAGQVFSNAGGFRFPDNTVQATAAATTASNGITKTGNNIALGGPLSQATTISQAGNTFSMTGGNVGIGTATPGYKLDVAGNANVTGDSYVSGKVGIGTTTPAGGLQVLTGNGGVAGGGVSGVVMSGAPGNVPYLELRGSSAGTATTPYLDFAETNNVDYSTRLISQSGTLNVSGSNPTTFQVNGNATVTGQLTVNSTVYASDRRFKQNIRPLGGALASVRALRGVRYEWNALGQQHGGTAGAGQVGLIAQEIEKIYPELVATGADGYKAVNYAQLAPVLIEAIKEQQTQIEALKAQVAAQASDHAALQAVKARAEADHTDLQTLQAQMARLLGETTAIGTQARR